MTPDSGSTRPEFVGRTSEVFQLTSALQNPHVRLILLVAPTGLGKSALSNHWVRTLQPEHAGGITRVFARSLFADDPLVRPHRWLTTVLEDACQFFGVTDAPVSGALAQAIRSQRSLVILDGVDGCILPERRDQCRAASVLAELIHGLVDENPGVSILTLQSVPPSLQRIPATQVIRLNSLTEVEGAEILHSLGVHAGSGGHDERGADERQLRQAARECGGHPVLISLLGKYLTRVHDGHLQHKQIAIPASATRFDVQFRHLLRAFTDWLRDGPELALLRLLAFSAEPMFLEELLEIAKHPAMASIGAPLNGQSRDGLVWAAKTLQDCGLVKIRLDNRLVSSQLVRQHIRADLRAQHRLPLHPQSNVETAPRI